MKRKKKISYEAIVGILLLIVVSTLTVGYATFSRVLNLHGVSTFKPNGTVRITSMTVADSSNLDTESHTINGMNADISVRFNNVGQSATYYITYEITVTNDSFYEYEFTANSYVPDISATASTLNVSYDLIGLSAGEKIKANSTKTFHLKISAEISNDHSGSININGEVDGNMEQEYIGSLIGSIPGSSNGDLVNNTLASFTASVMNTYEYSKTFTFVLGNSNNFSIVACDGGALPSMTITHNNSGNYNFCIKKNDGIDFASSPQSVAVYLRSQGLSDYPVGSLNLAVPVTIVVTDDDAPVISNLTATKVVGEKGKVTLSWNGSDENNINKYYIEVHKSGADSTIVSTLSDETSYTFTNIDENVGYYFVVYGVDEFGNCGVDGTCGSSYASNPSTSSGVAVRTPASGTASYNWTYSVSFNLSGLTSSGASTVLEGRNYTASLSANFLRSLPSNLDSVKMGGITLSKCNNANNCNGYTYSNGNITVYNVTGNLEIKATAGNSCLVKGTKVLLANGNYKNVEDITYTDLLAVWDYKTGKVTYEYPIWIEQEKIANGYQKITFSDGSTIGTVGGHGVYDLNNKMFVNVNNPKEFKIGSKIAKITDGKVVPVTVTNIENVYKKITYYHVVSTTYYNIIANDLLTTDDATILSNLYGFEDNIMWPKEREKIVSDSNNLYNYEDLNGSLPYYMFKGLRAGEAKYIVNMGYMSDEMLQYYFINNQSNPDMVEKPITFIGNRYWPVSLNNYNYTLIKEGETITLPFIYKNYFNTSDGKIYKAGDAIKIYHGTHFIGK